MTSHAPPPLRRMLVAGLLGSMLTSGCTRTVTHHVARFEPRPAATARTTPAPAAQAHAVTTSSVPEAGLWKVKVRGRGEKQYHGIDGTERWLQAGDVVGFRTGADGVVYALANKDEIPLALTDEHRRVVWHATTVKDSEAGEGFGEALGTVAGGALVVGTVGGLLVLVAATNDRRCERDGYCRKHRKRH